MKRLVPVVAALTLIAAACGGDDSASSDTSEAATSEATSDDTAEISTDEVESTEETDDDTGDAGETSDAGDPSGTDDTATDDSDATDADDTSADDMATDSGDGDGDGMVIRSMDDMPAACQDATAEFLRALEPIVSPIDWQNATMAEFEQVANDFQEEADEFQAASSDAGCDELVFDEDDESEILVEFARSEAPGAVGFLEFLELMRTSATPGGDDGAAAEAGIETCEDAIDFLQGLMDDYGSMSEVPASEVMKIPSIAGLYAQCTPEQLEFFDNPDLELFMGG